MSGVAWINEFNKIKRKCNGNFTKFVQEFSSNEPIKYRKTVLMVGLMCQESPRAYAEFMLEELGKDALTRRNPVDAVFIYCYEAFKNIAIEERQGKFIETLKEFFVWNKKNGSILEYPNGNKHEKNNHVYIDVKTFGDLYKRVSNNSFENEKGEMISITTDKSAQDKLIEIVSKNGSLSDFLSYLKYEDVAVRDYNRKATFYVQKMLLKYCHQRKIVIEFK